MCPASKAGRSAAPVATLRGQGKAQRQAGPACLPGLPAPLDHAPTWRLHCAHPTMRCSGRLPACSVAATYPAWEPDAAGQQLLAQVAAAAPAAAASGSLAWSLLPLPSQQRRPGPPSPRQQKLAAALAGRTGRPGGGPADSGGIFGSADFGGQEHSAAQGGTAAGVAAGAAAISLAAGHAAGVAPLDGVAASQLLLQSFYEQRDHHHQQQQPLMPSQQHASHGPGLAPVPSVAAAAAAATPLHQQRGFAAVQAPLPIPQQAPTSSRPGQAVLAASASPLHGLLASPAAQAAPSPRQLWHGRCGAGRRGLTCRC